MSLKTLDRLQVNYFRTAIDGYTVEQGENGSSIIRGLPVFRAGTFRDSMGEQHTWEPEHLHQMVFHFGLLRDREILPNVPVRDQHRSLFGGGGTVVGYVNDLRVEGKDAVGNDLLVADLDITEPDAFGKIERGTWRSRSAEIGYYETNDESMFWPVFMGVAWVDLPAVEGLFSKTDQSTETNYTPIHDEEATVPNAHQSNQGGTETGAPASGGEAPVTQTTTEQQEGANGDQQEGSGGQEGNEAGAGGGTGTQAHSTPAGSSMTPHQFSINGQPTTDFAAVQRHIDNLESVIKEGGEQARRDFVKSLASDHKIAATQIEGYESHVLSLTDEQFEAFKKMYEDAPASPLFTQHGQGSTTEPASEAASEIENLRERVRFHERSGMPAEKVKETESYKKLMSLTDNKG